MASPINYHAQNTTQQPMVTHSTLFSSCSLPRAYLQPQTILLLQTLISLTLSILLETILTLLFFVLTGFNFYAPLLFSNVSYPSCPPPGLCCLLFPGCNGGCSSFLPI